MGDAFKAAWSGTAGKNGAKPRRDEKTQPKQLTPVIRFHATLLEAARLSRKLSIANLALKAGVNALELWRWENGEAVPSPEEFELVRDALGMDSRHDAAFRVATGWQLTGASA